MFDRIMSATCEPPSVDTGDMKGAQDARAPILTSAINFDASSFRDVASHLRERVRCNEFLARVTIPRSRDYGSGSPK